MQVSIGVAVTLLLGVAVVPNLGGYAIPAQAVICGVAFAAALQAARADHNLWMIGLAAVALVFNPLFYVGVPEPLILWTIAGAILIQIGWVIAFAREVQPQTVEEVLHPRSLAD